MKCSACWTDYIRTRLDDDTPPSYDIKDAVTVWNGHALCTTHLLAGWQQDDLAIRLLKSIVAKSDYVSDENGMIIIDSGWLVVSTDERQLFQRLLAERSK